MATGHQNHPKCIFTIKKYAWEHINYCKLFKNFPSRIKGNYNSFIKTSVLKKSINTNI